VYLKAADTCAVIHS